MAKVKNDYFKLVEKQVEYCVQASDLLANILNNYSPENLNAQREEMHKIEQQADEIHHDILTRLSAEFITPIDQEDIVHLVQIIDDVTDALDEVVLDFYMYHIDKAPADAPTLAKIVNRCVSALQEAVKELKNFKKPDTLRKLLVKVNSTEGEADNAFVEAIHNLFGTETESKVLIGSKAIYESLENCCDLCEHASDVIEQIIIKNT
ncbi:MAG: DUF47 family protein [Lachnospiraceae bacterium]|nr:DUF47 family protein [Lachnospiraceae bacterium]MBR4059109.1 DUF47 family protein [Lachnospiraceae bacterium]